MTASATRLLDQVSALAEEWKLDNLGPRLAACRDLARAGGRVDVAVLGRFKAGKSSLLNHLAGRDVLPVGVVPVTAIVTRLRYGDVERARVRFIDGKVEEVAVGDIGAYVAEERNPDNQKRVATVEVELPELVALAPIELVDTPGLGSALVHNTEEVRSWLPSVGAAIVAISADAPMSEQDLALLDELRTHTPRIAVLLTKVDVLDDSQRETVVAYVRSQLTQRGFGEQPVFLYSVRPGFADLKATLVRDLLDPLRRESAGVSDEIFHHKVVAVARQAIDYLSVALAAAMQSAEAVESLRSKLAEEREQLGVLREELHLLARNAGGELLAQSLHALEPVEADVRSRAAARLRAAFPSWRGGLKTVVTAYTEWLERFLGAELADVSRTQERIFCSALDSASLHLSRALRAFQDRLAEHVHGALGLRLVPHELALDVRPPEAPPVDVSIQYMMPIEIVGSLVPMTLFRPLVARVLLRRTKYEVTKNVSRLAAKWNARVSAGIEDLRRQAEAAATAELTALEQMSSGTSSDAPRLRVAIDGLEAAIAGGTATR